jgi:TolB-like protein
MSDRPEPSYAGDQPFFFVSYGHADRDLVFPEMRWLQEAGFNLWYDEGIHVGSIWRKAIADALAGAAGMLFVATKSSVESDNCLKELSFVLDEGKPVFVVQLDDTKLPGLLRLSLADRQMLSRTDFDEATYRSRLIQALSTVARPTPRSAAEAVKAQRVVTTIPSIGLQVLGAGDQETGFWGEGLNDDLARLLGYRSFGITTTHDTNKDLAALGRALDVSYVISGSVRRADDRYRVNLRLTAGGTGVQVWGARYDEGGGPIAAADAIGRVAAIDISNAILADEQSRVRDADVERLDAWGLRLRAIAINWTNRKERDTAIDLARQAVERDPNYAMAHCTLCIGLCNSVVTMFSRNPDGDIAEAMQHVDQALSLAPGNPLVMQAAALPHRLFGDEGLALDLAERANAMIGNDSPFGRFGAGPLAACLIQAGREKEAIELMLASRPLAERMLHAAYAALGDWPQALTWGQRATASFPTLFLAWTEVANAMAMVDRLDEARDVMRRVKAMVPTFTFAYYEKGIRLAWRNRQKVVDGMLAGLRQLEMP